MLALLSWSQIHILWS